MKKILLLLSLFTSLQITHAQLNVELVSQLYYGERANDVWGYTAPDGTEYAMIGLLHGVSFVSLADPENPVEVVRLDGDESRWRDLRTFGHYAYIVADQAGSRNGLWAIDMSELPNSVELNEVLFTFENDTLGMDTLFTCHNVWVDENGFAYLTGCDINSGGVLIFDLNNDPMNPEFVGKGKDTYSHDNYVRNDLLYTSEINEGQFGIYDVSDKSNPVQLAVQETPYHFTHNVWLSDDGNTLFTTDEKANAPVAAYDVSDPNDILFLDEFRPAVTLGTGVIPHNVHVLNDYLVISHYTDGCVIVDAHEPDNLVEVGHYDTNVDFTEGFHGAWGAYPFFPSGLIAISDIENGLFILRPEYKRASYLAGKVTNINTGIGIPNAEVSIQASAPTLEVTNLGGNYKTGLGTPGTFNVTFRATGYFDQTILTTISAGDITVLDVQMVPLPAHNIAGRVVEESSGTGIPDAVVFIENEEFSYETSTDGNGEFTLPSVLQGTYHIYVGKWGYRNLTQLHQPVKQDDDWYFELARGYADNFNNDLGWQVSGDATSGVWERGIPFPTSYTSPAGEMTYYNPFSDSPWDVGDRCYVTGNFPLNDLFNDQVDNGTTILTSPVMALASNYSSPVLSYDVWWYTVGSNNLPNDTLRVWVTNGAETVMLEEYDKDRRLQEWQQIPAFNLASFIEITDEMQVFLTIGDLPETPNVIEAALDNFLVTDSNASSTFTGKNPLTMQVFPNPFHHEFWVKYAVENNFDKMELTLLNLLGQRLEHISLKEKTGTVRLDGSYPAGTYFLQVMVDGQVARVEKVVKF